MRLTKWIAAPLGALALCMAAPASAQDDAMSGGNMSDAEMAEFAQMMGGAFQAEPLTAEQEALLPLANEVVAKLVPEGFYEQLMVDVLDTTMRPMLSMFSGPDFVVMGSVYLDEGMPELTDEQMAELAATLDPAYSRRADVMIEAMTGGMGEMFAAMEGPMRDGMARYYATRFTGPQLGEIKAFFETPTGALYARESMAMAADPQFMSSIMGSVPGMMGQMGDFEARMEAAMADIPEPRGFDDLSAEERTRAASLLGISVPELQAAMEAADAEDTADSMED
ncbi:DUF2059 domain-containing protein [Altererythrobacter sp. MTPC7]|uniref:DUF2059 domain-containing protein n=1 Tax=Altererythrobacter sp. MTPC7 TaxID=3056567 RepID=UPI0036F43749